MRRNLLDPLEWRIAGPGPTERIVRLGVRPADLVDELQIFFQLRRHAIEVHHLIHGPGEAALRTRAVVADDIENERIVRVRQFLHRLQQPAALGIGIGQIACEVLHKDGIESLRVRAEREAHGFTQSGRGVSSVSGGMTPISSWRLWVASRTASHRASNCPLNFSRHSFGA